MDLAIADPSVSKRHAFLVLSEEGGLFLTDCQSTNGTFILRNGQVRPVRQEFVQAGDTVRFGSVEFSFEDLLQALGQGEDPNAPDSPPGAGRKKKPGFTRCSCGEIKVEGEPCRYCGN